MGGKRVRWGGDGIETWAQGIHDSLPCEIIGTCRFSHSLPARQIRNWFTCMFSCAIDQHTSRFPVNSHLTHPMLTFGIVSLAADAHLGYGLLSAVLTRIAAALSSAGLSGQWNISGSNASGCEIDHGHWQLWCLSGCTERDLAWLLSTK